MENQILCALPCSCCMKNLHAASVRVPVIWSHQQPRQTCINAGKHGLLVSSHVAAADGSFDCCNQMMMPSSLSAVCRPCQREHGDAPATDTAEPAIDQPMQLPPLYDNSRAVQVQGVRVDAVAAGERRGHEAAVGDARGCDEAGVKLYVWQTAHVLQTCLHRPPGTHGQSSFELSIL